MEIGDRLSAGLAMSAGASQMEARPAVSDFLFQPHSLTAMGGSNGHTGDYGHSHGNAPARDLRSVVERRFKRMNEAHDRIRTALLRARAANAE